MSYEHIHVQKARLAIAVRVRRPSSVVIGRIAAMRGERMVNGLGRSGNDPRRHPLTLIEMIEAGGYRRWLGPGISLVGLVAVVWSVIAGAPPPANHGRGLVILVALVTIVCSWLLWSLLLVLWRFRAVDRSLSPDLFLMAAGGAFLASAQSGGSAASAAAYVAMVSTGIRVGFRRGLPVLVFAVLANALAILIYGGQALGGIAYALSFALSLLGGSSVHERIVRVDQAELLLAQTQRSREEELKAARLQESARIARDIHDLLAHSLSGLTIQLEAAVALLDSGKAEPAALRERLVGARQLARDGLDEARRAVGVLRAPSPVEDLEAELRRMVADYGAAQNAPRATVATHGPLEELDPGQATAILKVTQEALTNVTKHAPGAAVSLSLWVDDTVLLLIENGIATWSIVGQSELAHTGGGFGIDGMRERAEVLGGELHAGRDGSGWRVSMRFPRVGQSMSAQTAMTSGESGATSATVTTDTTNSGIAADG